MNKPNLSKMVENAKRSLVKHSPEILTGLGIAGMITTTVLAVKATPKALDLIEQKREEEQRYDLTPVETIQACWKPYIPAAVTATVSIACLIGANSVHVRRNAALATAYQLSTTALADYKEKVVETIGEKKDQAIKDKIAKDKLEQNPIVDMNVIETGRGSTLCYDAWTGRYFYSDIDVIKKAVNELNRRMTTGEMYISLNDFYDELGLHRARMGDDLGWNVCDSMIELDFSAQIADNDQPCIVIDYLVAPRYDYYKSM